MVEELVSLLIEKEFSISIMESCTGGGLTNAITNIPNASKVISFSAITYSNTAKIKFGVDKQLIDKYGVYSQEVANDMARCISEYTISSYGIGITGKLNKEDENNLSSPNNRVYFSIYDRNNNKYYQKNIYVNHENRIENKNEVINIIVNDLIKIINS